jgi:hypothetical protein
MAYGPPPMGCDPGYYGGHARTHSLATTSLALGISSLPTACCCWMVSPALCIAAILCGVIALQKIKQQPDVHGGQGVAVAGIVLGAIGLLASLGMFAAGFGNALLQRFHP